MKINIEVPAYIMSDVFQVGIEGSALADEIWSEFAESLNLSIYFGINDAISNGENSVKIG